MNLFISFHFLVSRCFDWIKWKAKKRG